MRRTRPLKLVALAAVTALAAMFVASCGGDDGGGGGDFRITADADQYAGPAPLISRFTVHPKGADGDVSYRWRFDDGTTSREQNPTHRFTKAGYYTVIVDARDEAGFNDRQTFLLGAWTPNEWAKARKTPLTRARAKRAQQLQTRRTKQRYRELRKQLEQRAREQTQG